MLSRTSFLTDTFLLDRFLSLLPADYLAADIGPSEGAMSAGDAFDKLEEARKLIEDAKTLVESRRDADAVFAAPML